MLRREQLKTRANAKGKEVGETDGEKKGPGKGKGRKEKGKGRGKGKRSKGCEVAGDVESPSKRAKVSDPEDPPLPSPGSKGKGKGKGEGKGKGKGKGKKAEKGNKGDSAPAKPKAKAKSKAKAVDPVPQPKSKGTTRKRKASIPSAPATQDGNAVEDAAPPQVPREPQVMLDHVDSLFGELVRQWKSSKPILKGCDFPTTTPFAKSSLSCYYTRSRPAVGLKTKLPTDRTNKEFAYFSFKPQDAMNIGLARECAVRTVSYQ